MSSALVPLGSITDIASKPDSEALAKAQSELARRYHARRVAGGLLKCTRAGRVAGCGGRLTKRADGVALWMRPDRERGRVSGICLCGSSWSCPVCAPRIAAGRVGEVQELAAAATARGYRLYMETTTLPHTQADPVEFLLRLIQDARREMGGGRGGQVLRRGRVGYVDAGELTWGKHGAHPHIHRLSICTPEYDTSAQRSAWLDALRARGRDSAGIEDHAYDAVALDARSSRYICKVGLEVASSALATKASLTPLGMVYRIADGTLPRSPWADRYRWCCAALSQTKFAALRFSRGLRKQFGLSQESTDVALAAEESTDTDILLGHLDEFQWEHIRRDRKEVQLLFVAQMGLQAVDAWLRAEGYGYLRRDREECSIVSNWVDGAEMRADGVMYIEEEQNIFWNDNE